MENQALIFKSILIGLILINIFVNNNIQIQTIIYIIIASIVSYFYYNYYKTGYNNNEYMKVVRKMTRRNTPFDPRYKSFLYKNPALLTIFYELLPYCKFDTKNYKDALIAGNQLILLYESAKIGHRFPNQSIDLAEQLQRNILNSCQSLILSFPTTVISNYKFEAKLKTLHEVLQNIIDNIKLIYKDKYIQNGPDIYSPPPDINNGPWKNPLNGKEYNKHWNFYY